MGGGEGLTVNLKFMSNLRVRFGQIHTDSLVSLYVRVFWMTSNLTLHNREHDVGFLMTDKKKKNLLIFARFTVGLLTWHLILRNLKLDFG